MQHFLLPGEIKNRAAAIRYSLGSLTSAASVSLSSLSRAERISEMRTSSATKLTDALLTEERRLFDHLAILHPEWLTETRVAPKHLEAAE